MRRPRTRPILCALLVGLFAWSPMSAAQGVVMCIGPGGHVAVEASHPECDGVLGPHHDEPHVPGLTASSECVDLPLGNGASATPRPARPRGNDWNQLLPVPAVSIDLGLDAGDAVGLRPSSLLLPSPGNLILRSVILLV